ncbi:MAG: PAS domain S-box protein [Phycisphaerae bacterium]|jgi:PAS domain S-box-containing protein|nr:PAS domain S-box protein [Phycisphaerae bacterium]
MSGDKNTSSVQEGFGDGMMSALWEIVQATSNVVGEAFFRNVVRCFASVTGMRYCLIGELVSPDRDRVRTLAVWNGDDLAENFEYALAGTPCENVTAQGLCFFPQDVQRLFPTDGILVDIGVQSYMGAPLRDREGEVLGILAVMDVKPMPRSPAARPLLELFANRVGMELERTRAEEALHTSEEKFTKAFLISPDSIIISSLDDGRLLEVNEGFERITGYSRDEAIGKTSLELNLWARPEDREGLASILRGNQSVRDVEMEFRRKSGELFTCIVSMQPFELNGEPCLVSVVRDISEHRRAEAALREIEHHSRSLIDTAPNIILHLAPDHRILEFNPEAEKVFGRRREEVLGMDYLELFIPEAERADLAANIQNVLAGELTRGYENALIASNGEHRIYSWNVNRLTDAHGQPSGIVAIGQDVTERKKAEEELVRSEENYRSIFNGTNEALFIHDTATGQVLDVNQTMLDMYGLTYDEALSASVEDLSADAQQYSGGEALEMIRRAAEEGPQLFEWRAKRKNGEIFWAEVMLKRVTIGAQDRVMAIVRDITDRKRAEEARSASEQHYRTLVENMPVVCFAYDRQGRILSWNAAAEQVYGYSSAEAIGASAYDLIVTEGTKEATEEVIARVFAGQTVMGAEWQDRDKSGNIGWRIGNTFPLLKPDGSVECGINLNMDITDRKRDEEALRDSEARYRDFIKGNVIGIYRFELQDPSPISLPIDEQIAWIMDGAVIAEANDLAAQTHGYSCAEDVIGLTFRQVRGPDEQLSEAVLRAWIEADYRFDAAEVHAKLPSGEYRWHLRMNHGVIENGCVTRSWGAILDITERKRAEGELQNALSEIEKLKDRLEAENVMLRHEVEYLGHGEIVGDSPPIREMMAQMSEVAGTDATVLILGETGTGKELLACAIHDASTRKDKPLVIVNCAAMPATLIESELFGREKGAYTDALTRLIGRFELADGATIFLDEIGELPSQTQAKLLRVLQEGQFERLGSTETITVDVRVIAATNRDLEKEVRKGQFREDLFYRLNVFPITVPPLRERKEDIPSLVWAFLGEFGEKMGKRIETVSQGTMTSLQNYPWPGNIRELRNVIERGMIRSAGPTLNVQLPQKISEPGTRAVTLDEVQKRHIVEILEQTAWRVRGSGGAAEILGLKPSTLESRMTKLGIRRPDQKPR